MTYDSAIQAAPELMDLLKVEMEEYGQMLGLLERQQESIISRATEDVFSSASAIQAQADVIKGARTKREACQKQIADALGKSAPTNFEEIIPSLPEKYRPAIGALIRENNQLLTRIQQRVRQNHILLSRSLELMQQMVTALIPAAGTGAYNAAGQEARAGTLPQVLYDAVG